MWFTNNNIQSKYDRQILISLTFWAYKYKHFLKKKKILKTFSFLIQKHDFWKN